MSPKPVSWVIDRPTRGEVRRAAVAEPARPEPHVLILGDRELAARRSDVAAVGVEVRREVERTAHSPAARFQQLPVGVAVARQRKLELPAGRATEA